MAAKNYSGAEFNGLLWYPAFAYFINYGVEAYMPKYWLNQPPDMVDFYREKDVTMDMKFCDIAEITIPDDAEVQVIDGKFKTNKFVVKQLMTRRRFSYAIFSYTTDWQ